MKSVALILLFVSIIGVGWCAYNIGISGPEVAIYWISAVIFVGCIVVNILTLVK